MQTLAMRIRDQIEVNQSKLSVLRESLERADNNDAAKQVELKQKISGLLRKIEQLKNLVGDI